MKYYLPNILVVEGQNDASLISSVIDCLIVVTNGYAICEEDVEFLNNKRNKLPVLLLTDSDHAGIEIRNRLKKLLNNSDDVIIDLSKCNKNGKHGVAESNATEIINILKEYFTEKNVCNIVTNTLISELDINKEKRDWLISYLKLGKCNNKTFIKRLNYLNISKTEIIEALKAYGNK